MLITAELPERQEVPEQRVEPSRLAAGLQAAFVVQEPGFGDEPDRAAWIKGLATLVKFPIVAAIAPTAVPYWDTDAPIVHAPR